ncbi:ABC-2 type transport system ATP-binding protein [Inhella inkyongensis]|uniref:ABC-2 type transport system ATP-binding protein n=1 Tax=Inhella inkyongensis TaxID=392593 RepID=A0A840RWW3_9BURK|nr:ABC transporter ATP-binding protein [Inhella inkyongensis]MBB5203197.1 ABC-2 type transport system ATP-binding protein [Inhella inkyongensis]
MSPWVIETERLTRRFGSKTALDDLSLRVARGGVHAIVGANGAGKSTLFRILLGFMQPDAGSASVLGLPADRLRAQDRGRIGFVNEEHHLPGWMPVRELVALQHQQYAARWREAPLNQVLSFFQVLPQQRVGELSRGERAGLSLGLALAQGPELLLLDEPTLGLDVVAKRAFLDALMQVGLEQGCTIIYCSHLMDEIERLAEQLIVIERGRLRYQCEPEALCQRVRLWQVEFPFQTPSLRDLPGLLSHQPLGGLTELLLLDQSEEQVRAQLQQRGAARMASMGVSLDRAINGLLAQCHAGTALHTEWA